MLSGFLEKNRDTFSQDLKQLIQKCDNAYLRKLFENDFNQDNNKRMVTLSSQFRTSLDVLMRTLNACHPFFIRCIKPNEEKRAQMFDRTLCCRQLRYSGMMETARIRQAGYPIRYTYTEFVERFRHLGKNIPPAHKANCKEASTSICTNIFTVGDEDYQFGNTRIFLKDVQNEFLEKERSRILAKYILVLQKAIKGWIYRRRYLKLKAAALVMQKHFRARGYRTRYLTMRNGFQRLQAAIVARHVTYDYKKTLGIIQKLQPLCKGYVTRHKQQWGKIVAIVKLKNQEEKDLKKAGNKNYKHIAESNMQKRLAELNKEYVLKEQEIIEEDNVNAAEIVDNEFDFLNGFPSTPVKRNEALMVILDLEVTILFILKVLYFQGMLKDGTSIDFIRGFERDTTKEEEDLSAYNFRKFAATYFIKNTNPQYSKKQLKESLLDLPTPDDVIAAQACWITILRFMGDLPEPKFEENTKKKENIMNKLTQTLSRSFANRKEFRV